MAHTWDPDRYLAYADERGRPFVELLARIDDPAPATVVDLGCGPGNLTALLADRWPSADLRGVDSSPEMSAEARAAHPEVAFEIGDVRDWRPAEPVDVLVSNATLQWVPGHLDLLPGLLTAVRPGGRLAFQVPGNFDQPSHTIRTELAATPPYDAHTGDVAVPTAQPRRVSGTGARPTLQALPDDLRPGFEEEFRARLRAAYPETDGQVVLPFRRVFVVAQTPD